MNALLDLFHDCGGIIRHAITLPIERSSMTRTFTIVAVITVALAAGLITFAQAPANSGILALTGARIIDGTGRAPIQNGTIVINNGSIQAVGAAGTVNIPPGATRVDLAGKTIIPGLITAHAHLNVDPGSTIPVRDDLIRRLKTYAMYGVT